MRVSRSTESGLGLGNAASAVLRDISGSLGNEELQKRINTANGKRDQLLAFIVQRLQTMHELQSLEHSMHDNSPEWRIPVWMNQDNSPDAASWCKAARRYKEAAQAFCSGQMHQGSLLLSEAIDLEDAVFDRIPTWGERVP